MPSAIGERQMLPRQTIRIFIGTEPELKGSGNGLAPNDGYRFSGELPADGQGVFP